MLQRKRYKFISVLLSAVMFLSLAACGSKDGSSTGTTTATASTTTAASTAPSTVSVGNPDVLEVTRNMVFGDASDNPDLKALYPQEFEKKFGFKLKVNALPRNDFMTKVNLMITSGELKGLVSLFTASDVLKAIDDGTILPLDDYLKDNAVWNSMPDSYKNLYKYNGKTYAFGMSYSGQFFTRWVRKDWLDNLGLQEPKTVQDLYNVAKAFTENDPDGNKKKDTFGLTAAGTWNLQDIFQAFDAKLDNTGSISINWDPNDGCWVDSMLRPGMVDALKYLADMYKNGYLDMQLFSNKGSNMRENIYSGKAGSTFYWQNQGLSVAVPEIRKTNPNGNIVELSAITGTRTTNLNPRVATGAPYVLIKGTNQPKETVNAFINTFLGSLDGFLMGYIGMEGKNYKMEGNTIVQLRQAGADPTKAAGVPFATIIGVYPQFSADKYPVVLDGTAEQKQASIDLINNAKKVTDDAISKKLVYECPGNFDVLISDTYTSVSADVQKIYDECVTKAIMGEVTPEVAIANYKVQMKAIGGDAILKEANEAIGKTAIQTY